MPTYSTALARVLIEYSEYMMPNSPVINLMQASHPSNKIDQLYIMNEVLYHATRNGGVFRVILDLKTLATFSLKLDNRKRFNTIVFVDSLNSFYEFFDHIDLKHWRYSGYIVVALTLYHDDIYECMTKMFEAFWTKHIVNVVVMFMPHANKHEVLLYTYFPFSAFYCERAVPVQLNQYLVNKFLNKIVHFPEKLTNFYGCPVSVVTFKNPPFMFYDVDKNGNVEVDGIDGTVLRVLAQQLNFNVTMFVDPENWGRIYDNGTVTGAMRLVYENKVNMTIGFFASLPNREKILKSSYVYYTTNLVWIIPPGKPQSALKKLLNPLKHLIWILFIISILIGFAIITILKIAKKEIQNFIFGNEISSPGMNLINIVLGNSLYKVPFRNFSRFIFIIFTFYCFIIRSSYQGGLVKFMQLDTREPKMMSTKEMIDNNFSFYYLDSSTAYLDEIPSVNSRGKIVSYEDFNQRLLHISNSDLRSAFLTSESHLAYRNKMAFPLFLDYAHDPVFSVNLVIYMQNDSCLGRKIDNILINLVCSGLVNKWGSYWIDTKYMKEPPQESIQTLSMHQLEGAFNLLGLGLVAALLVFCVEIVVDKIIKLLNCI